MKLKTFIKKHNIRICVSAETVPTVVLANNQGDQYALPSETAQDKLTAHDVLAYLLGDCTQIADWRKAKTRTRSAFNSWCLYFGKNNDSIKALKNFNECKKMFRNMQTFMGENFDEFLSCRE